MSLDPRLYIVSASKRVSSCTVNGRLRRVVIFYFWLYFILLFISFLFDPSVYSIVASFVSVICHCKMTRHRTARCSGAPEHGDQFKQPMYTKRAVGWRFSLL